MRDFADLYDALDATTSTTEKIEAIAGALTRAEPLEAAFMLTTLMGEREKRLLSPRLYATWAAEEAGMPGWLFSECYGVVGDIAETCALVLDSARVLRQSRPEPDVALHVWMGERLPELRGLSVAEQRAVVVGWWRELDRRETFLLGKLLSGALRVGASRILVIRALAQMSGVPTQTIAHRLSVGWRPGRDTISRLTAPDEGGVEANEDQPYPFFLASPIDHAIERDPERMAAEFGDVSRWLFEWKWDGIRGQLIRRGGRSSLWSRGEEELTQRFPEIIGAASQLPDGSVLDGEVLVWPGFPKSDAPSGFAALQRRISRLDLSRRILRDLPAVFLAYDVLEALGVDVRERALSERRGMLEGMLGEEGRAGAIGLSPLVGGESWEQLAALRASSRERRVEGLMIKDRASSYGVGRVRGAWWKWKIDPYSVDAVLVYAQPGSGRRAGLFTDYTFALWDGEELVPVAKAYSGLSQLEIEELDAWIRRHITERFGPVRGVEPVHVFELHFEGVAVSDRHRSGLAVRFPRIAAWRRDKKAAEADSLATLRRLAANHEGGDRSESNHEGQASKGRGTRRRGADGPGLFGDLG